MEVGKCYKKGSDYSKKRTAFMSEYETADKGLTERECEYTFKEPKFQGIMHEEDADERIKYIGYSLTYQSE